MTTGRTGRKITFCELMVNAPTCCSGASVPGCQKAAHRRGTRIAEQNVRRASGPVPLPQLQGEQHAQFIGFAVLILLVIGLLVVFGVLDLIF